MKKELIIILMSTMLISCGISEMNKMMEKHQKMTSLIEANCNCDKVGFLGYSEENFRSSAQIEIIGADQKSKRIIIEKINQVLQDSINDYCKIDKFVFDFINKGKHEKFTVRYCKID